MGPIPLLLLAAAAPPTDGVEVAQLTIHQRIVIRIPRLSPGPAPAPVSQPRDAWVEKKAERCVPMEKLAGAQISRPDSVDMILTGGKRLRAHLDDDCPALDFYSGFYMKPSSDGKICAGRDSVRTRSGGQCRIEQFRKLTPAK